MENVLILENVCSFSKADHKHWTLYGDETRAYNPESLLFVGSADDTIFPEGMGCIIGWQRSVNERAHVDYYYILAECCEQNTKCDDPHHGIIQFKEFVVSKAIWLPIHHFLINPLHKAELNDFDKQGFRSLVETGRDVLKLI